MGRPARSCPQRIFAEYTELTALTRSSMGEVWASARGRELFLQVLTEACRIGRLEGVALPADLETHCMNVASEVARVTPDVMSSMCRDLLERRRLELDAIHGTIVERATQLGVEVPANLAIDVALRPFACPPATPRAVAGEGS